MYVAAGSAGFTWDPEQAREDIHGHPMLAGGTVAGLMRRERQKGQSILDMLNESLLDSLEAKWDLEEKPVEDFPGGKAVQDAAVEAAKGYAKGLATAIAAQKHTAKYLDPETRDEAIKQVLLDAINEFKGENEDE